MRLLRTISIIIVTLYISACSFSTDREWISDEKYALAQQTFAKTNSLDLTRQVLNENPKWRKSEINEAMYRLVKQYHLEKQ